MADLSEELIATAERVAALADRVGAVAGIDGFENDRLSAIESELRALAAQPAPAELTDAEADRIAAEVELAVSAGCESWDEVQPTELVRAMHRAMRAAPAAAAVPMPEYDINTASHTHVRIRGYTYRAMRAYGEACAAHWKARAEAAEAKAGELEKELETEREIAPYRNLF